MKKLSPNRILANTDNRLAAVVASSQRPAQDFRLLEQARQGGGRVALGGEFTGAADALVEVEVVSGTGGQLAANVSVQGVGSGTLAVREVRETAQPGLVRFALADLGKSPTAATFAFFGAELAAKTAGAAGNGLALEVARNLTLTPTNFSTLKSVSAGATTLEGVEWDWGQPAATAAAVPLDALRVQFAGYQQVHRSWKSWQDGKFVYHLDPAPEFEIAEGVRVFTVSGDYTVTVRQGTTVEVYPNVVTVFDFLTALQARSALVEVRSAVVPDRAPGGMAVTDIPLRTDAHARPAQGAPDGVKVSVTRVAAGAATENVTLRATGVNTWAVTGAVSGELGTARTGEEFSAGPVSFTVFDRRITEENEGKSENAAGDARIRWKFNPTSRTDSENMPNICMKPVVRGINAADKTVTFRYVRRPNAADCSCEGLPDLSLSAACLGISTTGGTDMLPTDGNQRRGELFGWLAQFTAGNLALLGDEIQVDATDIDLANACVKPLNAALEPIYNKAADDAARAAALTVWDAALTELKTDFSAYMALSKGDYGTWGEWERGRVFENPVNRHLYRVTKILLNDSETLSAPVSLKWPEQGDAQWLQDGTSFTLTSQTGGTADAVEVQFRHMGNTAPWGTFFVGQVLSYYHQEPLYQNGYQQGTVWVRSLKRVAQIRVLNGSGYDTVHAVKTQGLATQQSKAEAGQDIWRGENLSAQSDSGQNVQVLFEDQVVINERTTEVGGNSAGKPYVSFVGFRPLTERRTAFWESAYFKQVVVGQSFAVSVSYGVYAFFVVDSITRGGEEADATSTSYEMAKALESAVLNSSSSQPGAEQTYKNTPPANVYKVYFTDTGEAPALPPALRDYDKRRREGSRVGSTTSAKSRGKNGGVDKNIETAVSFDRVGATLGRLALFETPPDDGFPDFVFPAADAGVTNTTAKGKTDSQNSEKFGDTFNTKQAEQSAQAWTQLSDAELFDKAMKYYPQKYESKMWHALAVAGIDPKKAESDTALAGSECWTDYGGDYWWEDTSGFYLPAFTNQPYVSAVRGDDGKIRSTKEFGFGIVTACDVRLKEGDEITITISGTSAAGTSYSSASGTVVIPLIAAGSAPFTGGEDGDPTQTWSVQLDDVPLPDYRFDPRAPADYADAASPIVCRLQPGGIRFEAGDSVLVRLEGGTLRYRRDGGSWREAPIFAENDLGDGLRLTAKAGVAPSFVAGDRWRFEAVASYGTARLFAPRPGEAFAFDGDSVTLEVELVQAAPLLMLALHTLPATARVRVAAEGWALEEAAREGPMVFRLPQAAQSLRVEVSGAGAGAAVGWLWAGEGWQPTVSASTFTLNRQYGLLRGGGLNAAAQYRGRGTGGRVQWDAASGAALSPEDADALLRLLDAVAAAGVEPVCLVPDISAPQRAALGLLDQDDVEVSEVLNFNADALRAGQVISAAIGFKGVLE